jgi:hypothetical protein
VPASFAMTRHTAGVKMKTKQDAYVKKEPIPTVENQSKIDQLISEKEQLDFFADIIIDIFFESQYEETKQPEEQS